MSPSAAAAERVAGGAIAALGAAVVVASLGLDYETPSGPGPGFLPLWLGILLAAAAAALVARPMAPTELPGPAALVRVAGILGALTVAALVLERIGFLLTAALLVFFALAVLERRPLAQAIGLAVALALAFFVAFAVLLDVRLPAGPLGP